jgi:glyoxylase-like metal-dependent hydrolase (beta-lactamase superfamily II)
MLEYIVLPGNPFMENTYIISDETRECIIVDPGCSNKEEQKRLVDYIEMKCLKPVQLINTHCHIDHVLGNKYVSLRFGLSPKYHILEQEVLDSCAWVAGQYGIPYEQSPSATEFLDVEKNLEFGNSSFEMRFTPGHSPGSVSLINHEHKWVFGGDVLFRDSIGRTDLPGGNMATLMESIKSQLFTLDDDYKVMSGHGPETTIGYEKVNNPFLQGV